MSIYMFNKICDDSQIYRHTDRIRVADIFEQMCVLTDSLLSGNLSEHEFNLKSNKLMVELKQPESYCIKLLLKIEYHV